MQHPNWNDNCPRMRPFIPSPPLSPRTDRNRGSYDELPQFLPSRNYQDLSGPGRTFDLREPFRVECTDRERPFGEGRDRRRSFDSGDSLRTGNFDHPPQLYQKHYLRGGYNTDRPHRGPSVLHGPPLQHQEAQDYFKRSEPSIDFFDGLQGALSALKVVDRSFQDVQNRYHFIQPPWEPPLPTEENNEDQDVQFDDGSLVPPEEPQLDPPAPATELPSTATTAEENPEGNTEQIVTEQTKAADDIDDFTQIVLSHCRSTATNLERTAFPSRDKSVQFCIGDELPDPDVFRKRVNSLPASTRSYAAMRSRLGSDAGRHTRIPKITRPDPVVLKIALSDAQNEKEIPEEPRLNLIPADFEVPDNPDSFRARLSSFIRRNPHANDRQFPVFSVHKSYVNATNGGTPNGRTHHGFPQSQVLPNFLGMV